MDSVLRGNPAAELEALMDEEGSEIAIVAPSFPANRSTVVHGILNSGAATMDAVQVFAQGMKRRVESLPLETVREGPDAVSKHILVRKNAGTAVFVIDALEDSDLEIINTTAASLRGRTVLAGAAGFAKQIARRFGTAGEGRPAIPGVQSFDLDGRRGPLLVVAGTRQGETAAQVTALSQVATAPIITFKVDMVEQGHSRIGVEQAYAEAAEWLAPGNERDVCIIAVDSMFKKSISTGTVTRGISHGEEIAAALGALTARLLGGFNFSVLFATGGDTSLAICKSLGAVGIDLVREICPGIPLGRIIGGPRNGQYIITKSGRFGNSGSLLEIRRVMYE
jgi:uncharacterized protein YgbK (DUF1537 family)